MGDDVPEAETEAAEATPEDETVVVDEEASAEDNWIADHEELGYEPPTELIASGFESWRRRTASGAILSAVAMGLAQVFNLEHKKPAIIAEAPGNPYDEDDPVQVEYVPDDAEGTRVRVRPWLFGDDETEA